MTWDRIHRLELELAEKDAIITTLRAEVLNQAEQKNRMNEQRDAARRVAVRLEQELAEVTA